MAAFLGDIAFLFGVLVIAAGLLVLHRAGGDPRPVLLRTAGIVLLAGGIGAALCTGYYYLKYHFAGDLEYPYPVIPGMMSMMHGKDGKMMMKKMMDERMRNEQSSMDTPGGEEPIASPDTPEKEHEAHHAD